MFVCAYVWRDGRRPREGGQRGWMECEQRQGILYATQSPVVAVDGTGDGLFVMPVAPVLPTSEPSSSSARSVISDGDRARLSGWHAIPAARRPLRGGCGRRGGVSVPRRPPPLVRGSQRAEIEAPRLTV